MQYNRVAGRLRDLEAPVICTGFPPSRQHGVRCCRSNVDGILELYLDFWQQCKSHAPSEQLISAEERKILHISTHRC